MPMNRRELIQGGLLAASLGPAALAAAAEPGPNLVPVRPSGAPNYWCTWGAQTAMAMWKRADAAAMNAVDLTAVIEDYINEETVLGPRGWARTFFPKIRQDLYFMYDGGWSTSYASFIADRRKFPSFTGAPDEVILQMNEAVQRCGWRGAALWCRDTPGGDADVTIMKSLRHGRIGYLKIDVGDGHFHLATLRDQMHMKLTLEHVSGVDGGLNGNPAQDGRYPPLRADGVQAQTLRRTDVYRIYDLQGPVDLPTALDRVTQSIRVVEGDSQARALINAEHQVYLAAILGCTVGIMQHPPFVASSKPVTLDQVTRAIRWQRIAPPFAAGAGFLRLDQNILTDEWTYGAADASYAASPGTVVRQGAPARATRNLELPEVTASHDRPFVLAGRFANGTVAVGALPRVHTGRPAAVPPAAVVLDVADAAGLIGIFGSFERLTLTGKRFSAGERVYAQDLAGDGAVEITRQVRSSAGRLELPGEVIAAVGLAAASPGDHSMPGLVLKVVS